jgi:hypothetical protein
MGSHGMFLPSGSLQPPAIGQLPFLPADLRYHMLSPTDPLNLGSFNSAKALLCEVPTARFGLSLDGACGCGRARGIQPTCTWSRRLFVN